MAVALAHLALDQDAQEKVYEAVRAVTQGGRDPVSQTRS